MDLLFRNGTVVTDGLELNADIAVKDGVVKALGNLSEVEAGETIDCKGKTLLPGAVDLGLNLLDDGDFDPESSIGLALSTRDAAMGGVTCVISTIAIGTDEEMRQSLETQIQADQPKAFVDFGYHLLLSDWSEKHSRQCHEAITAGMPSFWIARTAMDSGHPAPSLLYAALHGLSAGSLVITSAHDAVMGRYFAQRYHEVGLDGVKGWTEYCPDAWEACFISMAAQMMVASRAHLMVTGLSGMASIQALQEAREKTSKFHGAVTLPHLVYNSEEETPRVWPPIRSKNDQQALFAAVEDGLIGAITSGHKPRTAGELALEPERERLPTVGMATLAHYYQSVHSEGAAKWRLSPAAMSLGCAADPAKLAGIYPRKGSLQPGSDADIVILDTLGEANPGDRRAESSRLRYLDPLSERKTTGVIEAVYLRGNRIVQQGNLASTADGKFLKRKLSLK